jgi:riboflavin kinase/FMN adenylyltransferase
MNIIHDPKELGGGPRPVCLAIGFFDGVHLGHQQIIRQTITDARQHDATALVITFDRHPNAVVAPDRVPPLIYSLPRKIRAIESLGGDALLLIAFDKAFSEQTGESFIRNLAHELGRVQSLCVGATFTFGHRRSGNVALLREIGEELGFSVHGLAAVALDGAVISSTRIREVIRAGNLDLAGQMLGRSYSIAGQVIRGDQFGRTLGFPTANLDSTGLVLPPNGVYAAHVLWREQKHRAVVNIGVRPTVQTSSPQIRIEAHLPGFSDILYGEEIDIVFLKQLRQEMRFESIEKLKAQIASDIEAAERWF